MSRPKPNEAAPRRHTLGDDRVHYTWDANLPPVLEASSGDEVVMTAPVLTEDQLLPGASSDDFLRVDWTRIHPLTGPIAIRGAEPGDVLEVRIKELRTGAWGVGWIDPSHGLLKDSFREPELRFFDLTRIDGCVEFLPGVLIPLAPFLGVMGVAPPGSPRSTHEPGCFGGNLDCKELTAGSRLFLPVLVEGGMFSAGDGHAVQGDGEVSSAIETAMTATLEFHLHKRRALKRPLVETARMIMTLADGESLMDAIRIAACDMVEYVMEQLGCTRNEAYLLCSLAGNPRINQVVNGDPVRFGARYEIPKGLLSGGLPHSMSEETHA